MRIACLVVLALCSAQIGCLVASDLPEDAAIGRGGFAGSGCSIYSSNSVWHTAIDRLEADSHSDTFIANMDPQGTLHAAFGSGRNGTAGIPFVVVGDELKRVKVQIHRSDQANATVFPVPDNAPMESGDNGRLAMLDLKNCVLYELAGLHRDADQDWLAESGAVFDLRSHILRQEGFVSADTAGMPIFPGLLRYEEVATGEIKHALRFSSPQIRKAFVWPARTSPTEIYDLNYPPMGTRFRLKANFRINDFGPQVRVILRALQVYGMFLADTGSAWDLSGAPSSRWDDNQLAELSRIPGSSFEAVDETPLMIDGNLGIARQNVRATDAQPVPLPPAKR